MEIDWQEIEIKERAARKNRSLQRVMHECAAISKDYVSYDPDAERWTCDECMERSTMSHDAMRHHRDCFVGIAQDTYSRVRQYLVLQ